VGNGCGAARAHTSCFCVNEQGRALLPRGQEAGQNTALEDACFLMITSCPTYTQLQIKATEGELTAKELEVRA